MGLREWLLGLAVVAAIVVVVRVYMSLRKLKQDLAEGGDYDTRTIERIRRSPGADPFKPLNIDFFFGLPDEEASRIVNAELEKDGFAVDIRVMTEDPVYPVSLHATKSMQLAVPVMKDYSRRFKLLAEQNRGRYDGWTAESERVPPKIEPRRVGKRPNLFS
jgi:hypothetical protein